MRFILLSFLLTIIISHLVADESTSKQICINIPQLPSPCINFSLDTCGDMGLSGSLTYQNTIVPFNITNASQFNTCISIPRNPLCWGGSICLRTDPISFRLTHSYAAIAPQLTVTCPGLTIAVPQNPTLIELGVDCDAGTNRGCRTCTSLSTRNICGYCPTTGTCVATSSVSTTLCDGISQCPVSIIHGDQCDAFPTDAPTFSPSTVAPTDYPTEYPTPYTTPTPTPYRDPACQNPMFTGPLQIIDSTLDLLPSPDLSIGACPDLNGRPSCCSSTTLNSWRQAMARFDSATVQAQNHGDITIDDITTGLAASGILPSLSAPNAAQLVLLNRLVALFAKIYRPLLRCQKSLVAYWNGLMCFACNPSWASYYNVTTHQLNLTPDTCDAVANGCAPVLDSLNSNKREWLDVLTKLYDSSGDDRYKQLSASLKIVLFSLRFKDVDLCTAGWRGQTSCRGVVCNRFIHGLDRNFTGPSLNSYTTKHQQHIMSTSTSTQSSTWQSMLLQLMKPTLDTTQRHIQFHTIMHTLNTWATTHATNIATATDVETETVQLIGDQQTPTGGHAINVYTSSGFAASVVGCQSNLSYTACTMTPDPTWGPTTVPFTTTIPPYDPNPTWVPTVSPPTTIATDPRCRNPMFTGPLQITNSQLDLLSSPAIIAGASCPDLAGKESCCTTQTFASWKQVMDKFDKAAIIAAKNKGNITIDQILNALTSSNLLPPFPAPNQKQFSLLERLLIIFKLLDIPLQTCGKSLVAYWNGLMCFSCHTDWANYYNDITHELKLSPDTCELAASGCVPVLDVLNQNKRELLDVMTQLYDSSGDTRFADLSAALKVVLFGLRFGDFDICTAGWRGQKSCHDVVCTQFIHGLDYNLTRPSLPKRFLTLDSVADVTTSPSPSPSPSLSDLLSTSGHWQSHLTNLLHPTSDTTNIIRIQNLVAMMVTWGLAQAKTQTQVMPEGEMVASVENLRDEQPPTGGHAINVYTDGGFAVNNVGCTAQMSKQACPVPAPAPSTSGDGSKSSTSLVIGILVGIVLAIIALVGLAWYCHKRRSSTRVPPHRRLQDQDFLGGVSPEQQAEDQAAYSRFDPRL